VVRLKNPHVVRIHDIGRFEGGEPYIIMEYLEGEDLKTVLDRNEVVPPSAAVDIALQALEAVAAAHAAGIIHRDLKPANLFLARSDDGVTVKVLDFGISKLTEHADEGMEMTTTHALMGSPYYMSPEQMMSTRDVDARTDIWSIGVVLYQMLSGRVPFRGRNIAAQCALLLQRDPSPPSLHAAEALPPGLDHAVLRFLRREPAERYSSAETAAEALVPFAGEDGPRALARIRRVLNCTSQSGELSFGSGSFPDLKLARSAEVDDQAVTRHDPRRSAADGMSQSTRAAWHTLPQRPASTLRGGIIAAGALAAIVLGGAVALVLRDRPAAEQERVTAPAAPESAPESPADEAPPQAAVAAPSREAAPVESSPTAPASASARVAAAPPSKPQQRPTVPPPVQPSSQPPVQPPGGDDPFGDKRQ
jgi:serine/threonine-protein kinase